LAALRLGKPAMDENVTQTDRTSTIGRGWLRRAYDWTLSWANHPAGAWALFFLAVAESSFFPVPPDVLLIALCVAAPRRSFRFAFICTVGSLLGGIIGYGIGHWGYEWIGRPIVEFYHGEAVMQRIQTWYHEYGFYGILIAAITPIPYKVFTITSGLFSYPLGGFLLASLVGRGLRFFCVSGLIRLFGPSIQSFIDRYFNWLAWAFVILLILGFVVLKFLKGHL